MSVFLSSKFGVLPILPFQRKLSAQLAPCTLLALNFLACFHCHKAYDECACF